MSDRIMLIDAYNVIHQIAEFAEQLDISLERARESLIRRCETWRQRRRNISHFCLVFDGRSEFIGGEGVYCRGVEVVFTRTGVTADEKILDIIRYGDYNSRQYVVVSNDNYVRDGARSLGAESMSVEEFESESVKCSMRNREPQESDDKQLSNRDKTDINNWLKEQLGI